MTSRQRKWQMKNLDEGKCRQCGKELSWRSKTHCHSCADKHNVQQRAMRARRLKEGKCTLCGKDRGETKTRYCEDCKATARTRKKTWTKRVKGGK